MKVFYIWVEGYATNGQRAGASILRTVEAETFEKAISISCDEDKTFNKFHSIIKGIHYYWGCQIFDNEADARESFG